MTPPHRRLRAEGLVHSRAATGLLPRAIRRLRAVDRSLTRRDGVRRILVDARTPVNFTMIAPVYRAMSRDDRVLFYFTASEEPSRLRAIYREAPGIRLIHPARAALMRFDAYVASDFMWAPLPRGTCRIQIFHGVGGKYGFDAPTTSMRQWDRLFFVNDRRLRNFVLAGAIDPDSPAARLVGMPKVDCLVDGSLARDDTITALGLQPERPTVLYAPTWSPESSLNAMGVDLIRELVRRPVNVIVKLHDRSRDLRPRYSGGVDWVAQLRPLLPPGRAALAPGHDISPYLVAADVMVTDHSSAGFEFLLRDRPLVRIHRPSLLALANVHADYVALLASVSTSVESVDTAVAAVDRAIADPDAGSDVRRAVAADLFHEPGAATARAVRELYEALELEPAESALGNRRFQSTIATQSAVANRQ
ncbi:MAG TPA: CDP-glycerol glycerophosphotransferase family protein [Vicinamibacterales bacterium]|nr:CDP-glycerol glycerophosphotransferase family protein [Vicinamibacterales bacterium]